jgi:Protein of unknown function (DUF3047)
MRYAACCLALSAGAASLGATAACEPRDLGFGRAEVGWSHQPLSKLKRDTVYTLGQAEGRTVLRAAANRSASAYAAFLRPPAAAPGVLSWRWKTEALVPGADNRDKALEDAPLRVIVAFDGDPSTLPAAERKRAERAKQISGKDLPYAMLMYIWSDLVAVETLIPSAHTSRVQMLVVASGASGLGAWQAVRRDVAADYRRAYGAQPGPVLGVGVMTDTDNTSAKAAGEYADLRFECTSN